MKQILKSYETTTKEVVVQRRDVCHFRVCSIPLLSSLYTSLVFALYLFSFCIIPLPSWGGAGTTGANFLRIGPGARQAGMGEAATGVADDAVAAFYNPASLVALEEVELHFMHLQYWQGINYEFAAFGTKLSPNEGLGWNLSILDAGKMDELQEDSTGSTFTKVGSFVFQNFSAAVTYSRYLDREQNLSIGANVKAIIEQAATSSRFGMAVDLGAVMNRGRYQIGLAVLNLGPAFGLGQANGDALPLTVRAGLATKASLLTSTYKDFIIAFDMLWPLDSGRFKANFGAELWFINLLAARVGYKTGHDLEGLTLGAGFKVAGDSLTWQLDYAFVPTLEPVGTFHRLELLIKFVLK